MVQKNKTYGVLAVTADCGSDLFPVYRPSLMVRWSRIERLDQINRYGTAYIHTRFDATPTLLRFRSQNCPPMLTFLVKVQYECII